MKAEASLQETVGSTLYFGYGSNLWQTQMARRCPTSRYVGVGRLSGYRWMCMERGYANVVPSLDNEVYGLVYQLLPSDLKRLDGQENVPYSYIRKPLEVDLWGAIGPKWVDVTRPPRKETVLVYVDVNSLEDDAPRPEYIHRLNQGIRDALAMGVPKEYVENSMRPFVPDVSEEEGSEMDKRKAEAFEVVHQHFRDNIPKLDDKVAENIAARVAEQEDRNMDMRREEAYEVVDRHFRKSLPTIDPEVLENIRQRVEEQEARDLDVRKSEASEIVHQHFSDSLPKTDEQVVENIAWRLAEQEARKQALMTEDER